MSKPFVAPISMPTSCCSQPAIMRFSPITSGIRSALPPSNGSPSIVPANLTLAMSPSAAVRPSIGFNVACCSRSSWITWATCSSVTSGTSIPNGKSA
jgi:hypothetical protein